MAKCFRILNPSIYGHLHLYADDYIFMKDCLHLLSQNALQVETVSESITVFFFFFFLNRCLHVITGGMHMLAVTVVQ